MEKIGVIGGGMIGASIASMFAGHGIRVVLIEQEGQTEKAANNCKAVFNDLVKRDLATQEQADICLTYLTFSTDYADLADMEFIFECAFERTPVKHAVYAEVEKHCKKLRAIASSTSAISSDELAEGFRDEHLRSTLVVAHPWNPPHLVPCVEIVSSKYTSPDTISFVRETLTAVGKRPVVMDKNIAGFIGNRLQYAMLREAIHIVEEGAATPEMVDETLKYSFAPRYTSIGIFEHFDNCGQDLTNDICNYLFPDLCDEKKSQKSLIANCEAGNLGVKSGKGMLNWEGVDLDAFRDRAAAPYYRFFDWKMPTEKA